ncbi:hypothetical protein [Dyadobacter psychrotolerans]|uniref:DinB family protein n=1 Tax=Dyadobacter psychrotolerans TaxID=2541721 RepID=A0A4R5DVJ5_9BACT|nr:hypothetical protein [Dyadobacter psychrotolerans]TDE16380.1 hypothetical protein E0F88_09050 [Dyadobacter psychrotolerans]
MARLPLGYRHPVFYNAYHCLIMLDHYLTIPYTGEFPSVLPFTFSEPGIQVEGVLGDMVPDRIYSKAEMLTYLSETRRKCGDFIENLTEEKMNERWLEGTEEYDMNYALPEILFYSCGMFSTMQHNSTCFSAKKLTGHRGGCFGQMKVEEIKQLVWQRLLALVEAQKILIPFPYSVLKLIISPIGFTLAQ